MSIEASSIDVPDLGEAAAVGSPLFSGPDALPFVGNLKVKLTAVLGEAELSVADLTALRQGSTLALDRLIDQPIDLVAEGHVVAQGTLVAVGDCFGVRITRPARAA